jgi:hypothetical protein
VIPAWLQWVFFGLGLVSSGAIALVLSDCLRTALRLRRMAREAARQDFSSDMVRQRTGADDARGDVACGSGVSDSQSVTAFVTESGTRRAAYCARCQRVAFLAGSILCPGCDDLRKGGAR